MRLPPRALQHNSRMTDCLYYNRAPNLNVFRDPRWGRGQETPGEDPLLTGDYASAFVSAMQSGSRFAAPATGTDLPGSNVATSRLGGGQLAVSACCKHFDAYSLENWDGVERYGFDALVDAQDLADTYLPAFRECVVTGGASCIMCAYNAVNGVPMCANKPFLTDLARGAWGFDGYITSDCDAVMNVWDAHNYTQTLTEAVGQVMRAGMDIDCGSAMDVGTMYEALSEGQVSEHMVDIALRRLLKVQFRLGMFDPAKEQPLRSVPPTAAASASHGHLALDAARQSLVLLKNDDSTLPITVAAGGRHVLKAAKGAAKQVAAPSLAVIGPHGNASSALQSNYFGVAPYLVTPLQGVQGYAPSATYAAGCSSVLCPNTTGFAAATALAAKADIVLLFMGLDLTVEREGQDRVSIALPGMQPQLIDAVIAAAPPTSTVVLILLSGGCVDISAQLANERIGAVLWAGYPGQEGGTAIADALFVAANGPSGRLTQTWYPASYVNEVSMTDMGMRPNASNSNPGRGYRFFTGTPVLPFGWGLTYSTFTVAWGSTGPPSTTMPMSSLEQWLPALRIDAQAAVAGGNPAQGNWPQMPPVSRASVVVTNSGPYAGSRIVLAFMVPPPHAVSAYGAPQKFLVWYGKTDVLRPGKSATLDFLITPKHLSFVAPDGLPATMTGNWSLQIDGGIVDNLVSTFAVTGASKNVVVESTATEAQYAAADTYWATMSPAHLD